MKDFLRDDLKYEEIPSKTTGKGSIFGIFHTFLVMDFNPRPTYPKKVWLKNTLPSYSLGIYVQTFVVYFFKAFLR